MISIEQTIKRLKEDAKDLDEQVARICTDETSYITKCDLDRLHFISLYLATTNERLQYAIHKRLIRECKDLEYELEEYYEEMEQD